MSYFFINKKENVILSLTVGRQAKRRIPTIMKAEILHFAALHSE